MRLTLLLLLISFGNLYSQEKENPSNKKIYSKVIGIDPYMTNVPLFGDKIMLKGSDLVEIVEIVDGKAKVFVNNTYGYIWLDRLEKSAVDEFKATLKLKEQLKMQKIEFRLDSVRKAHGDSSIYIVTARKGESRKLYDYPNRKVIYEIANGELVKIKSIYDEYMLKVEIIEKSITGYISRYELEVPTDLMNVLNKITNENKLAKEKELQLAVKERLIKKYGATVAGQILNHQIWIGMTTEQATESIGFPDKKNETVGTFGRHEQWIYPNSLYLYFENGTMTSFQKSN